MRKYAERFSPNGDHFEVYLIEPDYDAIEQIEGWPWSVDETDLPEELRFFTDVQLKCYEDRCLHPDYDVKDPQGIVSAIKENGPYYWGNIYKDRGFRQFVAFKNGAPIGQASTSRDDDYKNIQWMMGSYVFFDERSQGVGRLLTEARLNFLGEDPDTAYVKLWAHPNNEPSQKSARRKGFQPIGTHIRNSEDGPMNLYGRGLADHRPQLHTALHVET